jgi:hypothetical protein
VTFCPLRCFIFGVLEAIRADYYGGLRGICERGDWTGWLQYFLNGVARQAEDALSRAERIDGLLTRWQDKLAGEAGANCEGYSFAFQRWQNG